MFYLVLSSVEINVKGPARSFKETFVEKYGYKYIPNRVLSMIYLNLCLNSSSESLVV